MNKNILIVMGGGVVMAILVAMLVSFGMSGNKEVVQEGKVEILVASRSIKIGEELSDDNMKWAAWPEGSVFGASIKRKNDEQSASEALEGKLSRSVAEDEPLVRSAVVKEDKGNFVAAILKPGHRAVAISVKAESMVGGFITPGDFVDVILTYKMKFNDNDDPLAQMIIEENIADYATETVLENVKVMAIDQMSKNDDAKIKVGKTVTLEVNAVAAEKLALATEMGMLTLALRGIGDVTLMPEDHEVTTDVRMIRIREELDKEYEDAIKGLNQNYKPTVNNVKIYNGSSLQSLN